MRALDIDPKIAAIPKVIEANRVTGSDSHVIRARLRRMRDIKELLHDVWEQGETITNIVTSSPVPSRPTNLAATTDCRRLFNFLARYSAASARASLNAGCTRMLSTRSVTVNPAVTATAITEMSSAAWRPTIDPPKISPVFGSEMILTNPRVSLLIIALAVEEN